MTASCGGCKATWKQVGNQTGHCSGCHRTFGSIRAFDRHQHEVEVRPYTICLDPAEVARESGEPLFVAKEGGAGTSEQQIWSIAPTEKDLERLQRLKDR